MKISDKTLIALFIFATALVIAVIITIGGTAQQLLVVGEVVYIAVFLASFSFSRRLGRRLTDLTFKVEEMAAGDLSKQLEARGRDEVSQLTHALNELMVRLQTGVAQDVSKQKEIAQAKTDFVAVASHQLRTPLSIVKWYVDYLISGDAGEIGEEQMKYLKEVYNSNERLIDLVNALLDVSRIDVGTFSIEPEPTDIIERAAAALKKFKKQIEKKQIKVERDFGVVPIINLDPRLTKIVFENLISNAVKYTPEKGTIRIVIKKTEHDVLVKISDNGCGIPREHQPKIFSKFFRADNVRRIESSGTGLGLYIAKAVIDHSGGKMWFQSPSLDILLGGDSGKASFMPIDRRNKGTTFFFTIPLKGMKRKRGTKKLESIE